jgi:hypothetical protein
MPAWEPRGLYASLLPATAWLRLPSFKDFGVYLRHPANWVAVFGGCLLVVSGWRRQYARRPLGTVTWAVYALAGLLLVGLVRPALGRWSIAASRLRGHTGREEGTTRTAVHDRTVRVT